MEDGTTPRTSAANRQLETGYISEGQTQVERCADHPKTTKMDGHNTGPGSLSECSAQVITTTCIANCPTDLGEALGYGQPSKSRPQSRRIQRRSHLPTTLRIGRLTTILDHGVPSKSAPSDTKTIYTTSSRRHKKDKERQPP